MAKYLGDRGIPLPAGKPSWQTAVVQSILTNEKYKGHA
ncbi:MAG: recombinase family protein [Oscillospiraceae bacterium]|nr:recombinase family protein [Oscillospiraceae bacterium]